MYLITDPCFNYTLLNDADGRFSAGVGVPVENVTCQRSIIKPKWYRVQSPAGEDMPTQCVERFHCHTRFPIWLKSKRAVKFSFDMKGLLSFFL